VFFGPFSDFDLKKALFFLFSSAFIMTAAAAIAAIWD
jgi:hypothetical protein